MVKPSFVTNHLKRVHTGEMLYNVKKKKKSQKTVSHSKSKIMKGLTGQKLLS